MGLFEKKPINGAMCLEKGLTAWYSDSSSGKKTAINHIRRGAEVYDDKDCQFYLGAWYLLGKINDKREFELAVHWLKKAANHHREGTKCEYACELYSYLGVIYLTGGDGSIKSDFEEALMWIEKAGNENKRCYKTVGDGFATGEIPYDLENMSDYTSVKKDYRKALYFYEKAVEAGDLRALKKIGDIYYEGGYGVKKNYNQALFWCKKKPEPNCNHYDTLMARIYAKGGHGVLKDVREALNLCMKNEFELSLLAGEIYQYHLNVPDYKNAFVWYTKAIENSRLRDEAQEKIGWLYLKGLGVKKDIYKAVRCLFDSDYIHCKYYRGYCYHYGIGVASDYDIAYKEYKELKLGDKWFGHANNQIGLLHQEGLGVPQSHEKAFAYFKKAVNNNCIEAFNSLGDVYKYGYGVDVADYNTAFKFYKKAAERGRDDNNGQFNLGLMHLEGKGTEVDYELALHWFKRAQILGNEKAHQPFIDQTTMLIDSQKQCLKLTEENLQQKIDLREAEIALENEKRTVAALQTQLKQLEIYQPGKKLPEFFHVEDTRITEE